MSQRLYYEVLPNSPILPLIQEYIQKREEFRTAVLAFIEKHGADDARVWEYSKLEGVYFAKEAPPGWRSKGKYWVPNLRNKRGKELQEEIRQLPPGMTTLEFSSRLGNGFTYWGNNFVQFTVLAQLKNRFILSIPMDAMLCPLGCRELYPSEIQELQLEAKENVAA